MQRLGDPETVIQKIFTHLSPVCLDDSTYRLNRLPGTLPCSRALALHPPPPFFFLLLSSLLFFHLKGIAENLYFPMCLRQVLPPLISNLCQPQSQQMWAYWRSVLTTVKGLQMGERGGGLSQGDPIQQEERRSKRRRFT